MPTVRYIPLSTASCAIPSSKYTEPWALIFSRKIRSCSSGSFLREKIQLLDAAHTSSQGSKAQRARPLQILQMGDLSRLLLAQQFTRTWLKFLIFPISLSNSQIVNAHTSFLVVAQVTTVTLV